MTKHASSLAVVAAAALSAVALGACGTKTIDSGDLEKELKSQIGEQGGKVKSAKCPDDIEAKKGKKFNCTVTPQTGQPVKVQVTLKNDDGGFTAQLAPNQ